MTRQTLCFALFTLAMTANRFQAVSVSAAEADTALSRVLSEIKFGQAIRVHLFHEGEFTGKFEKAPGGSLYVVSKTQRTPLFPTEVDTLWQQVSAPWRPSLVGGGAGLMAGLLIGGAIALLEESVYDAVSPCIFEPCEDSGPEGWKFVVYGAGIGAAAGTLAGNPYRRGRWERVYPPGAAGDGADIDSVELWKLRRADGNEEASPSASVAQWQEIPHPDLRRLHLRLGPDPHGRLMLVATMSF